MSGLIRNLITIILALFARGRSDVRSRLSCHFLITPFDIGITLLKSDKYLQLAEAAQIDFLARTKLLGMLMRNNINFVNAAQLVKLMKPISVFCLVRVDSGIVYADDKCAYFSHSLFLQNQKHGEILVKMKFKQGSLTISPTKIAGDLPSAKLEYIEAWNVTLEAME